MKKTSTQKENVKRPSKIAIVIFRFVQYGFEMFCIYALVALTAMYMLPFLWSYMAGLSGLNLKETMVADALVVWWVPAGFVTVMIGIGEIYLIKQFHKWLKKGCDKTVEKYNLKS